LTVTFTNLSDGATNYTWTFGDGKSSTVEHPANTYTKAGSYTVTLTAIGAGGTNSLTRADYIVVTNAPPSITDQPLNQTVKRGSNATFNVTATGTPPLGYQWRFNAAAIAGATASSYTRASAQCTNAGDYDVVVTNATGSVTSSVATLTVIAPPAIAVQPTNQTIMAGSDATFTVTATNACGGGLTYQWRFNRTGIAGATAPSFTRTNARYPHGGNYDVVVTNAAGSVTSSVAVLTVITQPEVTFVAGSTNGPPEAQVLVPVQVNGFTNISVFQFSLHWSNTAAAYVGVEQFGLPGLAGGNFGTTLTNNGTLTVSWADPDGLSKSVANGTTI
ncbi:MAG: PKD domain-containing protein, partial [Candidatus Solibacter sp.]|nr:PKD domain-containing protein [Candidatus Solibacter sp.]